MNNLGSGHNNYVKNTWCSVIDQVHNFPFLLRIKRDEGGGIINPLELSLENIKFFKIASHPK